MTVLLWATPPGQMRGQKPMVDDDWGSVAKELRDNPGRWGVIWEGDDPGYAANLASSVQVGRYPSFRPGGSFEAVSRKRDGVARVYARFVGGAG